MASGFLTPLYLNSFSIVGTFMVEKATCRIAGRRKVHIGNGGVKWATSSNVLVTVIERTFTGF